MKMAPKIPNLSVLLVLIASNAAFANKTPPPPTPPPGTPIDNGILILLGMGIVYAFYLTKNTFVKK
jgi:hypothetical protein